MIILNCTQGENSRQAKLTNEQIYAIRAAYDAGMTGRAGAAKFNISPAHYNNIGRRIRWTHLQDRVKK